MSVQDFAVAPTMEKLYRFMGRVIISNQKNIAILFAVLICTRPTFCCRKM